MNKEYMHDFSPLSLLFSRVKNNIFTEIETCDTFAELSLW